MSEPRARTRHWVHYGLIFVAVIFLITSLAGPGVAVAQVDEF